MPRKAEESDRFLILDENLTVVAKSTVRARVRRFRRRLKGRRSFAPQVEGAPPPPSLDSLMRTRKLVMAALRVWELRNGIRDPF